MAKALKEVEKERQEIRALRRQLSAKEKRLEGMEAIIKLLEKPASSKQIVLRYGSDMYKVQKLLEESPKPLHIREIVKGLGKDDTSNNRVSIASSIGSYARNSQIFAKVRPNTFGLVDKDYDEDSKS